MTVDTYKKYQETVESSSNRICRLKQRDDRLPIAMITFNTNKGRGKLAIV